MKAIVKAIDSARHSVGSRSYRTLMQLLKRIVGRPRPVNLPHVAKISNDESETNPAPLRWGIAPISLVAEDFATALSVLPSSRHCITSCMDIYRSKAVEFADKHQVPNVYTSLEELARCPDVDAVYISPLNPMHCELCHLMLNHDKHVLCEQPLGMVEKDVVDLVRKAKARGLFLMEGMWPRCMPAYQFLQNELKSRRLGTVYMVDCTLGWNLPIAQAKASPYAGVSKDLGPYAIQLALWIYREVPERIKVTGRVNSEGIDVVANVDLIFKGNRCARLKLSAVEDLSNTASIRGTLGSLTMDNSWCPTKFAFKNKQIDFKLPTTEHLTNYNNRVGLCYEAEEIRNCILGGYTESRLFNHDESRLMSHLTNQIGDILRNKQQDTEHILLKQSA